ncbi:hypothetical protein PP175_09185 [Aneurinibacillus sp. Ricciae_BoGa-3]|uniref:hypothetical protein n=1 Tax=Aneurinibacillus sp. Ricciae_BoGa-3 TaxID=3022697 RepID=UPI002341EFB1|nr:hypothetical protein [Aneurinibacillus sp. Ricciae_BoGa-3]WCK56060.1 hypothetical protein PP175_09185 [Aneurinibacillus sp. Ricciae_BoGa-3]
MKRRYVSYDERYNRFLRSVERLLFIAILVGLVSLFLCQALLGDESFRSWAVETVRLEGIASP